MNLLIKSTTVIDSQSDFNNKTVDILVENGRITKIDTSLSNSNSYREVSLKNSHISQGWFDSGVCFGEPGFEERETIIGGLKTAAASGFTAVALQPNTNPPLSTSADITFVKSKAAKSIVNLVPIGALTKPQSDVLSELFDMKNAGAVAFGNYKTGISNANLLKIALQYTQAFDGLILSFPINESISKNGVMNEHIMSTSLGLKGLPNLAEELQVARDIFLLEYTQSKLHIPTISTKGSVDLIRRAKGKKLNISCSVAVHNLMFNDSWLDTFDTNFKVMPPLRTDNDIKALKEGLEDGTIDMVTSDHNPLNIENKKVEFDYALDGTIGLESAFGALNKMFSTKKAVKFLTRGKERFGFKNMPIAVGNVLNATLFNPEETYTFNDTFIRSKSKNSLFLGSNLKGRVYGVINNNKILLNNVS